MRKLARLLIRLHGEVEGRLRLRLYERHYPYMVTLIRQVRRDRITYIPSGALLDLALQIIATEKKGGSGAIVEAGTALGGSAIILAAMKGKDRPLILYDTFGMIPPPSEEDGPDVHRRYARIVSGKSKGIGGSIYYGYRENLEDEVASNFRRYGMDVADNSVVFVKGRYEDVMDVTFTVAFAHLDCDWYSSTQVCLEQLDPHLVVGGRIVVDDYYSWSGCALAVDEFLAKRSVYRAERRNRLHLVKDPGATMS